MNCCSPIPITAILTTDRFVSLLLTEAAVYIHSNISAFVKAFCLLDTAAKAG